MVLARNLAAAMLALAPAAACSGVGDSPVPPLEIGSSARLLSLAPANATLVEGGLSRSEVAYPSEPLSAAPSYGEVGRAPLSTGMQAGPTPPASLAAEQAAMLDGIDETSWDERRDRNAPMTLASQAASLGQPVEPLVGDSSGGLNGADDPSLGATAPASSLPPAQDNAALAPAQARLALAEVTGVGPNAAEPLATRFGAQAKARNLVFTTASDTTATHVVKGYFSTAEEGGQTVVTYVWDISDRNGKRLHRIQGREAGGAAGAGWDGVSVEAMQRVADHSIEEMAQFLSAGAV